MTKLTRIEEVKKITELGYEIVADELSRFIDEFKVDVRKPHKWRELSEDKKAYWQDRFSPICQLSPQPLDDKELREKIGISIRKYHDWNRSRGELFTFEMLLDQILALLQPKIEEAKRQKDDEWKERLKQEILGNEVAQLANIKEAKREERGRLEDMFADNEGMTTFIRKRDGKAGVESCKLIIVGEWQALKGGK